MDFGLLVSLAVSAISIGLYIAALGDHRTLSALATGSNYMMAVTVVAVGLGYALGLEVNLIANPQSWLLVVGDLAQNT
jgi:hypothetical protein